MAAVRAAVPGSTRLTQAHFEAVNEATGTMPTRSAQAAAPPRDADEPGGVGGGPGVVPEHGRVGAACRRRPGRQGRVAARRRRWRQSRRPARSGPGRRRSASHHTSGCVSRAPSLPSTVCDAWPWASMRPVSTSTTTTLVDCVEQSTPAASLVIAASDTSSDMTSRRAVARAWSRRPSVHPAAVRSPADPAARCSSRGPSRASASPGASRSSFAVAAEYAPTVGLASSPTEAASMAALISGSAAKRRAFSFSIR